MNALKSKKSGQIFKKWLTARGLSYNDFAQRTDIAYPNVARWARGLTPRPTSQKLIRKKFPDCPLVKR